jgi:hypothetical protein
VVPSEYKAVQYTAKFDSWCSGQLRYATALDVVSEAVGGPK